jgi:hypothetical protein
MAAIHDSPEVRQRWEEITLDLAGVNPNLLRRVIDQLLLSQTDSLIYHQVADKIEDLLAQIQ